MHIRTIRATNYVELNLDMSNTALPGRPGCTRLRYRPGRLGSLRPENSAPFEVILAEAVLVYVLGGTLSACFLRLSSTRCCFA